MTLVATSFAMLLQYDDHCELPCVILFTPHSRYHVYMTCIDLSTCQHCILLYIIYIYTYIILYIYISYHVIYIYKHTFCMYINICRHLVARFVVLRVRVALPARSPGMNRKIGPSLGRWLIPLSSHYLNIFYLVFKYWDDSGMIVSLN